MNPLLDFSGLPRFAEIKPEHVAPAVDELLAEGRAAHRARRRARCAAPTWDDFVAPLEDANERLRPRLGPGRAPARGDGQPGAARGVQREPAEDHAVLDRARPEPAAVREVQGARASAPSSPRSRPRSASDRRERAARFPPRRRRAAAGQEGALHGDPGRARRSCRRASPRTCSTRPTRSRIYVDRPKRARRHSRRTCSQAAREAAQKRRQGGLEVHAARAVVPAGDAVRRRPRAARDACTAQSVTRASEFGKPEWDNTPLIAQILDAAPRAGAAARLRQLRRGLAGAEDGRVAARRCSRSSTTSRAARGRSPSATSTSCATSRASELGLAELEAWDLAYASREAARRALRVLRPGGEAVLPRGRGAAGHVPRGRDALRHRRSRRPRRRSGTRTCASSTMRDAPAAADRPVLPRPLRARDQARRRLDGRRDHAPAQGERRADAGRLPQLQLLRAGRRQARALHARRGASRCSTSSATACTTCSPASSDLGVSGINGVEWDAVELPSQFMENFCWEWDVLRAR